MSSLGGLGSRLALGLLRERAARLAAASFGNPLFLKETRQLFRSPRTGLLHIGYLALLGCAAAAFAYFGHLSAESAGRSALWSVGVHGFRAAYALHLAVVGFFVASMASVAVSSERERRTWELLAALPLGPAQLLGGKFLAILAAAGLMVVSSLPVWLLVAAAVGGVTPSQLAAAFLALLGFAALVTAVGLLASVLLDDSRKAFGLAFRVLILIFGFGFAARIAFSLASPPAYLGRYYTDERNWAGAKSLWELVPVPASAAGSLGLFAVCVLLAFPVFTAAVEALKPPEERRPEPLFRQLCGLFCLLLTGYVAWSCWPAAGEPRHPGIWFAVYQGMLLMLLSVAVLPERRGADAPDPGTFSGGPAPGARLLVTVLALSNIPLAAATALGLGGEPQPVVAWVVGECRLLLLVGLWSSLAELCLAAAPRNARTAFIGGLLALVVLPSLGAALSSGAIQTAFCRLLELNPLFGLALLDPLTREAMAFGHLQASGAAPGAIPVLMIAVSLGFLACARVLRRCRPQMLT